MYDTKDLINFSWSQIMEGLGKLGNFIEYLSLVLVALGPTLTNFSFDFFMGGFYPLRKKIQTNAKDYNKEKKNKSQGSGKSWSIRSP